MELASITERTFLIDPGGNRNEQAIEQRIDPLTGTVASVNLALGEKAKAFLGSADVEMLRDFETRSKAGCPFCSAEEKGRASCPTWSRRDNSASAKRSRCRTCSRNAATTRW